MRPPLPNTYWAVPGRLLAGEYPGGKSEKESRRKLRALLEAGADVFVDLTVEEEGGLKPYELLLREEAAALEKTAEYRRMPIREADVPKPAQMRAILDALDEAFRLGKTVYLHSRSGAGRAGLAAACLFVRQKLSGEKALEKLAALWRKTDKAARKPKSPETAEQEAMILHWDGMDAPGASRSAKAERRGRCTGSLLGLAVGDALGATTVFRPPGSFDPLTDMTGGGPFGLSPGQWTNDTAMALCLAASLAEKKGFDGLDQIERYMRWWREGYMSCTGRCFDISHAVRRALETHAQTGKPFCGADDPDREDNSALTRLAPVAILFSRHPVEAVERARQSARVTHGVAADLDACRYFAGLLAGAVNGAPKEELLSPLHSPAPGYWTANPLAPDIAAVAAGSFKRKVPPDIRASGTSAASLEAALWAFAWTDNFRDGCLLTANLGEDSDTTAAIYGQLAGAFYGADGIPDSWLEKLAMRRAITALAGKLADLSEKI